MKKNFIQNVLNQVAFKEAHFEIEKELSSHMDELSESLAEFIKDPVQLENEVVRRMGPTEEIGRRLNDIHRPQWDWLLILLMVPLLLSGLYMQSPYGWMLNQIVWMILGLITGWMLTAIKPAAWAKVSGSGFMISLAVTVAALWSSQWADGQPYIHIPLVGLNIKIIDLSSALFTAFAPGVLLASQDGSRYGWINLILVAAPFWIYSKTGSLFPIAAYGAALFGMMIVSQIRVLYSWVIVFWGMLSFSVWTASEVTRSGTENHHTDLVLNSMYQIKPALALCAVTCGLLLASRLFSLGMKVKMTRAKITVMGIASFVTLNLIWGTLANFGYAPIPVGGLNFPFVSYGGSMMVGQLALMGVVLGYYRRKNLELAPEPAVRKA